MSRVIVVGAGVIGLSCAVRLLEAGHRVDVIARDLPHETTSRVAAAIWYPYRARPEHRVAEWSARSFEVFEAVASGPGGGHGVRMTAGTEVLARRRPDPAWAGAVGELTRATDLPVGYADGWSFVTPVIEMPLYLTWLAERVQRWGGTVTRMNLRGLPEGADVVVNCTGIGARMFAEDTSVTPVRGQVVYVEQFGLERWWLDGGVEEGEHPTYIVPRSRDVVVGGTDEEGEWSRTPSPDAAAAILARAARLVPEVASARVLAHKVGLRPYRPSVRVEREGRVVHCYGHGGAGVTLSWGCAEEVVALVEGSATTPRVAG